MNATLCTQPFAHLHASFLEMLPRIETHARIVFRDVPCRDRREDQIAEVIALAWKWYVRLAERGKSAEDFLVSFSTWSPRRSNRAAK